MKKNAIVLAAGKGTRMKSETTPKVCHKVSGKPMLQYIIDMLEEMKMDKIIVVVGHEADIVKQTIKGPIEFVLQEEQKGTGHAIQQVSHLLEGTPGITLVLMGDAPLIQKETLEQFLQAHESNESEGTVMTTIQSPPTGYGRIVRTLSGKVSQIIEEKDAFGSHKLIEEVNTGVMAFNNEMLFHYIYQLEATNAQNEFYLTDMVSLFTREGLSFLPYLEKDNAQFLGINDRVQMEAAEKEMRKRINQRLMMEGVTLLDADSTYIEKDVVIGQDTIIHPNVVISGNTVIGKGCVVEGGSHIIESYIGDRTVVKHSYIQESRIGEAVAIGPFAHIRPETVVGSQTKVGNFVELKKSVLKEGSKVSHLSYIGDAEIGKNVNIGCGTITVNYDGKNKFKTVIEDEAFIGCNSNLMAPLTIGKNAVVAAGSTITDDVPQEALAIARQRQENKIGYAIKEKNGQNI